MSELSRLRWLCRRGMKELDVVMTAFLESNYHQATKTHQKAFVALLNQQDPELYALLLAKKQASSPDEQAVIAILRQIKTGKTDH